MTDYLPGINVVLNDLGLKVAPPPAGPKLTLLGVTSNSAIPLREPYTVSSVEKAINSLYFNLSGVAGYPSTNLPGELALAIEEAVNAGAQNIEVMVIGHYSGSALHDYISVVGSKTGRYADLSGAYDVLRNRELDFVVPVGANIDDTVGATSNNFGLQLANFCYQATAESNGANGVIGVKNPIEWALYNRSGIASYDSTLSGELVSMLGSSVYLTGAIDTATSRAMIKHVQFSTPSSSLINAWQLYLTEQLNAGYNVTKPSVFSAWISGAADQNGNILDDVDPNTATSVNAAYFASWQAKNSDGSPVVDSRGTKIDAGQYISVFAAPVKVASTQAKTLALAMGATPASTSVNTNGASAYAGKILSLSPQSSTTNKIIDGIVPMRLLSAKQANELTGLRYVTMYARTRGLVVARGITGAHNVTKYVRSDYTNLTTIRIVLAAVDLIRSVGDKYIGEPNNAPQINALESEVSQVLNSMKAQGALNAFDFSISATPDERVLGTLNINLTLVPAFEITDINLVVSLSKEL